MTHVTWKRENNTLHKSSCHLTVKEKMVDRLTTLLTHTTPSHHKMVDRLTTFTQIIQSQSRLPHKETNLQWNFGFPYTPPRERGSVCSWRREYAKNGLYLKDGLFEGVHCMQSVTPIRLWKAYNFRQKAITTSTYQSWTARNKGTFHCITPLDSCIGPSPPYY